MLFFIFPPFENFKDLIPINGRRLNKSSFVHIDLRNNQILAPKGNPMDGDWKTPL